MKLSDDYNSAIKRDVRLPIGILALVVAVVCALPARAPAQTTEADVFIAQAIIDFEDKRYDAALDNLRRALEIEPEHLEALYYTGVVQMARNRPGEAVPFLLRARQKAPTDPAVLFQLGLSYFAQQEYDQAGPIMEQIFAKQPTLDGLGYYVGFMRYRKKDYRGTIAAFREGRASDADIQQLTRFYSGLALAVLGLPTQAAAEVEQALRASPSSPLTGPAERLRDTIVKVRERERRFTAELKLGTLFDDNVSVIPDRNPREPVIGEIRHQKHESAGELLGLRLDYSWLKDVLKRDDWDANVGYSFFSTYNNDVTAFNVTNHLVNTGLTHTMSLGAKPAQAGLQYSWDLLTLGGHEFIRRNTATLYGALGEGSFFGRDNNITQIFTRYQNKDFNQHPSPIALEVRDANNYMAGFLHIVGFKQDIHFVKFGYQYDWDDASGANYVYRGHRFQGGGQYTLPVNRIRLRYDFDAHIRDYTNANSILPTYAPGTKARQDEEITHAVRAEIPLGINKPCFGTTGGAGCVGWTLAAEYQHTHAASNIEVFQYTRNVFSLMLSLTY